MIYTGDCLTILPTLPAQSVHCCVTSPPYWGLRDYGTATWEGGNSACSHKVGNGRNDKGRVSTDSRPGNINPAPVDTPMLARDICPHCGAVRIDDQLGMESTPAEYVQRMVQVFREVWRVLRDDGTLWLNLGDSYYGGKGSNGNSKARRTAEERGYKQSGGTVQMATRPLDMPQEGLKPKDLVGIPWRVAFALQNDGWYLRQDIIWHKPNPMPESVQDRCTKAHEYVFLFAKQQRYYCDMTAIQEAAAYGNNGSSFVSEYDIQTKPNLGKGKREDSNVRNKRSVWTVATAPYEGAHFATMPPKLVEPCILAGCPVGGTVLDPFTGSGTTGAVAASLGRNFVGIELNPAYVALAEQRIGNSQPALQFEAQP
jgi:DNA modification methylase